jgi:hypothetical protein
LIRGSIARLSRNQAALLAVIEQYRGRHGKACRCDCCRLAAKAVAGLE